MEKNVKSINEQIVCSHIRSLGNLLLNNIKYEFTENILFTKKHLLDAFKVLIALGWTKTSVEIYFSSTDWISIIINDIEF